MKLSTMGDTGVTVRVGDGIFAEDGSPLHDSSAGKYGRGPHVVFDDGSFAWTKAYPVEGGVENLLEDAETGWLFYTALNGDDIADDSVAFRGSEPDSDPADTRPEYFLEWAESEGGWTMAKWDETVGESWPDWLEDCRAWKHWSPAASHAFEAALVGEGA